MVTKINLILTWCLPPRREDKQGTNNSKQATFFKDYGSLLQLLKRAGSTMLRAVCLEQGGVRTFDPRCPTSLLRVFSTSPHWPPLISSAHPQLLPIGLSFI